MDLSSGSQWSSANCFDLWPTVWDKDGSMGESVGKHLHSSHTGLLEIDEVGKQGKVDFSLNQQWINECGGFWILFWSVTLQLSHRVCPHCWACHSSNTVLPEMTRPRHSDPVPLSWVWLPPPAPPPSSPPSHLPLPELECAQAHIQFLSFN